MLFHLFKPPFCSNVTKEFYKVLEEFFTKRGMNPTENNWKQAMVPEGAVVVNNPNGTAPGLIMAVPTEINSTTILFCPPFFQRLFRFFHNVLIFHKKSMGKAFVSGSCRQDADTGIFY